jgi:hypothetical protein
MKFALDKLIVDHNLPIWDRLHGFWRTLPNFNPPLMNAGSKHGEFDRALELMFPSSSNDNVGGEEVDDATPLGIFEGDPGDMNVEDGLEDDPGDVNAEDGLEGSDADAPSEVCGSFKFYCVSLTVLGLVQS